MTDAVVEPEAAVSAAAPADLEDPGYLDRLPEGPPPTNASGQAAPAEVEEDIIEEIRKYEARLGPLDHAPAASIAQPTQPVHLESFDRGYGLSADPSSYDFGPPATVHRPAPAPAPMGPAPLVGARTLDDLYCAFPKLGQGEEFFLQVERRGPATYRGVPIKGWLANVYSPLTNEDIKKRWGGGTYLIRMMGAQLSQIDDTGIAKARTLSTVEVVIAGEPLPREPEERDPMTSSMHRVTDAALVSGGHAIEREKLRVAHEERMEERKREQTLVERLLAEREKSTTQSPNILKLIDEAAERRVNDVRDAANTTSIQLRRQLEQAQAMLEARERELNELRRKNDEEVKDLRDEIYKTRHEAQQQATIQETARITELKDQHERELRRIKEEHAEKLASLVTDHRQAIAMLSETATKERMTLIESSERERRREVDEYRRREETATRDHQRELSALKESLEARLRDEERQNERELRATRESFEREMRMLTSQTQTSQKATEVTTAMQVRLLEERLTQEQAARAGVEAENRDLNQRLIEQQKSPIEAFREAKEMVAAFGGPGAEKETKNWSEVAKGLVEDLGPKIPDIARDVMDKLSQRQQQVQQAHAAQAQAHAEAHARAQAEMQHHRQLGPPMPRQAAPGRRHGRPPPGMNAMPPPGMGTAAPLGAAGTLTPTPAPITSGQATSTWHLPPIAPVAPVAVESMPTVQPAIAAVDHLPAMVMPMGMAEPAIYASPPISPIQPERAPAPPPAAGQPPAAQPVAATAAPPEATMSLDPNVVAEFLTELETAVASEGLISAEMFAQGFVGKIGPDAARAIVTQYSAERIVESLTRVGGGAEKSLLVTLKGRRYLGELWQHVERLTSARAA